MKGAGWLIVGLVIVAIAYGQHQTTATNQKVQVNVSSIHMGDTLADVKAQLGKPDNAQHSVSSYGGTTDRTDFLYYGDWQFGFENGRLNSKSKY